MSEAKHRPTAEQPVVKPTVAADPGRARSGWAALPSHLGRARTSTVVLALLFLAIGTLYLYIRPDQGVTSAGTSGEVQQSATPVAPPTTTAPERPTSPEVTGGGAAPTTSQEPTETVPPTETTGPTDTSVPTSTSAPVPTTTAPEAPTSSPTP